jgi:tripeptide aminopeptidase
MKKPNPSFKPPIILLLFLCCFLIKIEGATSSETCANSEHDYVTSLFTKLASLHTCSGNQFTVNSFRTVPVDSIAILDAIASELQSLKIENIYYTTGAVLMATIPPSLGAEDVTPLAFVAHVDQACAYHISQVGIYSNGRDGILNGPTAAKPWVHKNWDGEAFSFADDPELVMSINSVPRLASAINKTLITASGLSTLGADGLAGAVSLLALARRFSLTHRNSNDNNNKNEKIIKHGPIRLIFMPASEINCAVHLLSPGDIKAPFAFFLDAETPGDIRYESPIVEYLSFRMQSYGLQPALGSGTSLDYPAVYNVSLSHMPFVAASVLTLMSESRFSCDTSKGREPYFEITKLELLGFGITLQIKLRAFDESGLLEVVDFVRNAVRTVGEKHSRTVTIAEVERTRYASNNWDLLGQDAGPVRLARAAMRATGQSPVSTPTRELTDAWGLSTLGVPSILLFSAWHAAHGPLEWTTVEEIMQVSDTVEELAGLWLTEHAAGNKWCPAGKDYDANDFGVSSSGPAP